MKKILSFAIFILCISSQGFAQSKGKESQEPTATPQGAFADSLALATPALGRASYPSLPLTFEKNTGQTDGRVEFISRGAGYNLFLTADEAVLALWQKQEGADCGLKARVNSVCDSGRPNATRQEAVLWLKMLGANPNLQVEGLDALPGKTNYFIGNDPKKWQTNVPNFAKVIYRNLYPGIDLTYYGNQQRIESDFVLAPGADPNQIQFEVQGANGLHLDAQGNLILGTNAGEVQLLRPGIYQVENGSRREVAGRYVLKSENRIGFEVAPYDTGKPLVIDPTLVHASFLGGSGLGGDLANAIAMDATGVYVTGQTTSADFPGTVLFPQKEQLFFLIDTFITKFNPAGNQLLYSDIIGGASFNSGEGGSGIGVDGTGSVYVVGTTGASNFPTVNPFQATFGAPFETAYVLRLSSDGTTLLFSTFYGGRNSSDDNRGNGIFVEPAGNLYVVGDTTSPNFPTLNPIQGTLNGFQNAFVGEFNPSGQLLNSTYLGGSSSDVANAVAVDSTHRAYITGQTSSSDFPGVTGGFQSTISGGQNAFVTRFNATSSAIEYSTYLRGTNDTSAGNGIVVDSTFNAYVTGQTSSNTFPLQGPAQSTFGGTNVMHAFITKFNPTGAGLVYSTLLGGENNDFATGIGIDGATPPNAYVTGVTQSTAFNLVNPMQAALAGTKNAFITRINGAGSAFDYSTYLGGIGTDQAEGIAVDPATGNATIVGVTNSPNFPVLGAFQSALLNSTGNAFVAEISPTNPTTVTLFPPAFSFGTFGIGQTSFAEPVTLSNYSGATITVNTISLTGANAGDFAQTNTCGTLPAALANGASCIIHVTFSPTAQDLRTATVSVDDTGAGSPHTMSVSGIGSVPEISLNKTSVNFGNSPLDYPTFNSVLITNTGGVPLHISSIQFSGTNASEFTTSSCIVTLAPGGECFVSISFIPVAAGARSASMLINSDAAGSPQVLPLTGTGVAEVIVQPTAINFGSQIVGVATFAGDFTLVNGSGVAITLGNPAATEGGANPGDFPITLANTTCQNLVVLQPGITCIVEAKFLPVAAGPRAATISFAYTGFAGSPIVVNLTGNGLVGVSLANTNPNFGNQFVGFTTSGSDLLYNATSGAITVSSIVIGGTNPSDFTATLNASCAPGGVVLANSSCPIDGTFTPSALGARSATATVSYTGAPGSPLVANLMGTGVPGPILLSPFSLTYGGQITGTTSLPQRVILSNLSTVDLHISTVSTGSAVFSLAATSNCISGATVKAGASCVADVVFVPTATGAATATLVFTDDGPGSPRNVALSGVGEPPAITVSTSTLDFGNQTVGQTSVPRSVFLINGGASQITITTGGNLTGTNSTEFVISNKAATTCLTGAKVLGSGGTCAFSITLTPTSTGPKTATLTFTPSAGGTQVVTLIGTGVLTPQISLSPTFISFANPQPVGTTSASQTVTLTNTGNAPLMLSNISVVGTNPGDFTTSGSTCAVGTPVPPAPGPGNTCTFSIAFAPVLADVGFLSASLDITSNSMNNPNTLSTVSLSGQSIISGITVVPASFDYGLVAVGASSTAPTFTVTNNTNTPMVTGTLTFAGTDPGDFSFSFPQSCGTIAAFGGNCSITFTEFSPGAVGARSGQIQMPYTGPAGFPNPLIVNLTGTGSTVVAFSPNPVTFPSTALGGFASPISAFLTNGTGSSVTITNTPSVTGTNASDFSIGFTTCTSGVLISSGSSSCEVDINFNPTARGSRTAQLVYTLSAGGPITLILNGTATGPVMGLAPSPVNFPPQIVNTVSGSMFVTVSNTGDNVLSISKETLTGTNGNDFSFPSFISCFSVAPGSNCTIEIAFTPSAPGARTGLLTVTPTPPIAPQMVVLNGTGVAGTVAVSPTTLTYSSQQIGTTSGSQAVQLKNTSNGPVMLTAVGFSGANAAEYAIAAGTTCTVGASIPALTGSCIANITFSPTATSNPRVAVFTISDNVFGAHPVNLSGTAVNLVVFPSPNPLDFPSQNVGTASSPTPITVNNFSPSVVTVSGTAATITGTNASDFSFGTNTCTGAVLPASTGSCTINVIFQPASAGGVNRTANLTFAASDPNSPHVVVLNGVAAQPIVGFNSNSISFPNENTGISSPQQSVTLTNNGNASLTISSVLLGGANPGSFVQVTPTVGTDCRTVGTVIAGSSCVVAATFTPAATGSQTATITLTDNATPTSQVVNLSGTGTQPGVNLNPATIPFGNQRQNTTSAQSTSILTNNGTGPLTISNVALGGANPADYALATPASGTDCRTVGTVAAGASCTIAATFTPSALGSRTATVTVTDDASPTTQVLSLTGTGVFPQATPTPNPVAFGNQRENATSATQVLTLTNGGTDTLHLTTVVLGGANANQFAIAGGTTCTNGSTVLAGANCIVNLTFTPTALGAQTATVTFTDDANPTTQVANLTGTGVFPQATPTPNPVPFGNQRLNAASGAQTLTLTNGGTGTLDLTTVALGGANAGDFAIAAGTTCTNGSTVLAGANCIVKLTFTPTALGSRTATVTFTDDANPTTQVANLTGTGVFPQATPAPSPLAFGNQTNGTTSAPQTITLSNGGTGTLNLATVALGGTNPSAFAIAAGTTCTNGSTVLAGANCIVNVTFTPNALTPFAATVTFTDDASPTSQVVNLSGTGVSSTVNFAPSTIPFGNQRQNTTSAQMTSVLTNSGATALTITGVSLTGTNPGDYALATPASGTDCRTIGTVAAGGNCTLAATFTPTALGARSATVSVADNATGSPHSLPLTGTGTFPQATPTPNPVAFGNQRENTTSATQVLTLTNGGTDTLHLTTVALGGTNVSQFAIVTAGTTCTNGSTVLAGASCIVNLTFTPTALGAQTATVTFTDDANPASQVANLTGTGVFPQATPTPNPVAFGNQRENTTSATQVLTLTNGGTDTLHLTTVALGGANANQFAIAGGTTCTNGAPVAAGSSCIVNLTFTPTALGAQAATVTFTDDANPTSQIVSVTGTGVFPQATAAPSPLAFGNQTVGNTSAPQTITLSNGGTGTLNLATVALGGANPSAFAIAAGTTCTNGSTVLAGASCIVNVTFTPTALAPFAATVTFTDDANPTSQVVNLSGTGVTSTVNFAPSTIPFGNQRQNTTSAQMTSVLTNSGATSLTITGVSLTGTNPGDYALATPASGTDCRTIGTVPTGGNCTLAATFTPTALGARSATVSVADNATGSPHTLPLTGTGTFPQATPTPNPVAFGNQRQNTTSTTQVLTLTNGGTDTLHLTTVALGGTNVSQFAIVTTGTTCTNGATVAPGSSCIVNLTFTPTGPGSQTATVTFTDDANPTSQVANLTGTGVFPQATPTPSPVAFGNQRQNTTSPVQVLTLTNGGTGTLDLTTVALGGPNANEFVIAGGTTCTNGSTVLAGASCIVNLTFTPTALGAQAATVTFTDDANPTSQIVSVTGTGVFPQATPAPSPLAFGNQTNGTMSAPQTITLSNGGTGSLNLTTVALGGANPGVFAIAPGTTCTNSSTVLAGASCVVNVIFTPTALTPFAATVTFTDDASPTSQVVNLSGTGVSSTVNFAPSTIPFGNQRQNTTSAQMTSVLTNSGATALTITGVSLTGTNPGDYALATPASGTDCRTIGTVAAGGNCTLAATFTPTALGARSATVSVADSAAGSPHTLPLTGTGTFPQATPTPNPVAFGNQRENTTSATQVLTLTNGGTDTLHLTTVALGGTNVSQFAIVTTGTTCTNGATVLAGSSCIVNLTFTPTALGAQTATVTFTDDANPASQVANLTGTGVFPQATPTPNPVAFGNQRENATSATQVLTLTNGGTDTLHLTTVALGGANANQFAIAGGTTCTNGGTVAAGSSCIVNLTFTPTALGAQAATVTFTDDANPTTQVANLTGAGVFPQATPLPATLPFGNQTNGTMSAPQTITLTNGGTSTLNLTTVALGGANPGVFAIAPGTTCTNSSTVLAGASCVVNVIFTPTALTPFAATVTFTDDASPTSQVVNLSGTGVSSTVNFAPSTIPFGNQRQNTTSAQMTSVLTNSGATSLTISSVNLTGINPGDYALVTPASGTDCRTIGTVPTGGNCTLAATFTPTALGARSATVSVADNATGSPHTLQLTGTGTAPAVSLNPASLPFANQITLTTSAAQTVTLTNTGTDTLHLTTVALGGTNPTDFAIASGTTCTNGSTVVANASCVVNVTFTPPTTNPFTATLAFTDDATTSPQIVNLTGTGVTQPTDTLSTNSLSFGNQRVNAISTAQSVTITNSGGAPLNVTDILINGANPADFAFAFPATTCPTTGGQVAANSNCTLSVTFDPAAVNARSASIAITVTGIANPAPITLTGTGIAPSASPVPNSAPFGNQEVSTSSAAQSGTLNNTGTDVLHVTSVAITGANATDFSIVGVGSSCTTGLPAPVSVAAAANCTWSVKFTPTALGARTASLTFTDDSGAVPGSTQAVTLTGTGTAPVVVLAPTTLTFSNQVVNTTSAAQSGTLTNTGTTALHLATVAFTGPNAGDFAIAAGTTCTNGLAVAATNGTCNWSVTFTPSAIGTRTASLTFTDDNNGTPNSMQSVMLTGTTPPAATLSANTIAFGNQGVSTASSPSKITVTNPGGSTLHITTVAISGTNAADFAIAATGTTCTNGSTVAPTLTCDINVTFTPGAVGARGPATMTITDDASPSTTQTVSLNGTGIDFSVTIPTTPPPAVAGQPIIVTVQITPAAGGFPNSVTFSATNLPPNTTGAFNPMSLTPGGAATSTVFTLTTTPRNLPPPQQGRVPNGPPSGWWLTAAVLGLLGIITARKGIRTRRLAFMPLAVLLLGAAILTGCAKAGGTPAGTYTVTVSATSGSLSHSTTVSVTVQ